MQDLNRYLIGPLENIHELSNLVHAKISRSSVQASIARPNFFSIIGTRDLIDHILLIIFLNTSDSKLGLLGI
jgi:hypothetical protein